MLKLASSSKRNFLFVFPDVDNGDVNLVQRKMKIRVWCEKTIVKIGAFFRQLKSVSCDWLSPVWSFFQADRLATTEKNKNRHCCLVLLLKMSGRCLRKNGSTLEKTTLFDLCCSEWFLLWLPNLVSLVRAFFLVLGYENVSEDEFFTQQEGRQNEDPCLPSKSKKSTLQRTTKCIVLYKCQTDMLHAIIIINDRPKARMNNTNYYKTHVHTPIYSFSDDFLTILKFG